MKVMTQMQRVSVFGFVIAATILGVVAQAQVGDPGTLVQEKLASQIKLTKTAADHSDIVTSGDVVELHKDGLMMCSTASGYAYSNSYVNGVLSGNMKNRTKDALKGWGKGIFSGGASDVAGAAGNGCPPRKFVAGEKFWVTGITLQKDGILISTYSDPYNDVRYYGEIKFPFPKGSVPPPDAFAKTVSEVITVAPSDDKDKGGQSDQASQQGAGAAPAPAPAAPPATMAAIPPPPPPADVPPPTIAIGQTRDQVTAAFGQPVRTAKVGAKEIYFYKDMKVTFSAGKVSNVE
jgi:hypothetical protein